MAPTPEIRMKLKKRQQVIITHITDQINRWGLSCGAHRNRNWTTQSFYDGYPEVPLQDGVFVGDRMQGTLDRIKAIRYHQCFHTAIGAPFDFNLPILGRDLYDHSIHVVWKEPIGKGYGPNPPECLKSSMTVDGAGNWHMPCDLGMSVQLWHPTKQKFQEGLFGSWNKDVHGWTPKYHYQKDEVVEALQIICSTLDYEFYEDEPSRYMNT